MLMTRRAIRPSPSGMATSKRCCRRSDCHAGGTMKGRATPGLSRRDFLAGSSAFGALTIAAAPAQITTLAPFEKLPPYGNNTLPAGVKPRLVPKVNGLTVNLLEAGTQGRPLVLLLHGFPNLA